jgi:hypothetical protein
MLHLYRGTSPLVEESGFRGGLLLQQLRAVERLFVLHFPRLTPRLWPTPSLHQPAAPASYTGRDSTSIPNTTALLTSCWQRAEERALDDARRCSDWG